jgi:predicted PurR-regulated permease PerM
MLRVPGWHDSPCCKDVTRSITYTRLSQSQPKKEDNSVSRKWSLLILFGIVVVIGVLAFQVVQPLLFPILFALILSILFRPVHTRLTRWCRGRQRIAAALTTLGVVLVVLIPLTTVLLLAGAQMVDAGKNLVAKIDLPANADEAKQWFDPEQHPEVAKWLAWVGLDVSIADVDKLREAAISGFSGLTDTIYKRTLDFIANAVMFVIGAAIVVLGLYYFLADGDKLSREIQRLSPLEAQEGQQLFARFENVCRGVVLGTVAAAVVQGALAAVGFSIIGIEHVWMLAVLTMLFSLIPFMGAAAVWISVTVALLVDQRFGAAVFLTFYGLIIISGSDNLIKAYVIGDRAQMHPFVVLVTVLGALHLVGLWGVFLGPLTAAFFFGLLNILHHRLFQDPAHENTMINDPRAAPPALIIPPSETG